MIGSYPDKHGIYNHGKPFTLTEKNHQGKWLDDGEWNDSPWEHRCFTDGRLEYIDTPTPAIQGPVMGERAAWESCRCRTAGGGACDAKRSRIHTELQCGMVTCRGVSAVTERDLDGYKYCRVHESEGRWGRTASVGEAPSTKDVAAPDGPRFGETSPTPDKGSLPIGHLSKPPLREVHAGGSSTPDPYADGAFTFERGEKTKHPEGTPLTALQRIQARKKPEPWYPSVDDWDLLPDAGR